jgi:hypothetical protein
VLAGLTVAAKTQGCHADSMDKYVTYVKYPRDCLAAKSQR